MQCNKTLAFYIRLSEEDADLKSSGKAESNSVTNQRKLLRDYYEQHTELCEYEVVEFCDDGYTGTNFDRPQFMLMMEQIRRREIQAIMVKDLSRFGRDYLEVGAYLELILPLFGTRFISANDNFDSDNFIGTTGGLELALRNLINGLYSRDLSVKVRSANKTRSRRGEYWGGSAFYGYRLDPKDKHHLLVDQETAPVVVRIFEECIAGRTAAQIARALNDDGIPSPASYKEKNGEFYNGRILEENPIWVACTVLRIIKDERYTGKMISNKRETVGISTGKMRALPRSEWIIVEDAHEAIISQSIFSEADASRRSRIKTVNQNTAGERADNLFVCGYCGRKLQKSKGKVTHLFCLKAGVSSNADCTRLHEPIETLQSSVLEVVKMLAKTLAEKAVQVKANANREEPLLEKKAAMLKRTLQRAQNSKLDLYEEYRNGRMTRDKFIAAQEERQTAIDSMRDELAATEAMITKLRAGKEKAAVLEADAKGIQLLNEYRPKELRKLIEKVRVYENGRIEIDFRCHDDFTEKIIKAVAQLAG